jgi:hypothetical protein
VQVSVLPVPVFPATAAPLLPIAVLAAWSATRGVSAAWPAVPVIAITLGIASEQRVAWFLLALLPTVLIAWAVAASDRRGTRLWRPLHATAVAAAGGAAYLCILLVTAGDLRMLPGATSAVIAASAGTGVIAAFCAVALWPLRIGPLRFPA